MDVGKMSSTAEKSIRLTGTQINYYFHCRRQLWYFTHDIRMESSSDTVFQGKLLHKSHFEREKKEIEINNIKLDFFDIRDGVLHEIKKSPSFSHAHEWQVLYYLYILKQKGIQGISGCINYPKSRTVVDVDLTPEKENQLLNILNNIDKIIEHATPPDVRIKNSICRKCSYFEFCFI